MAIKTATMKTRRENWKHHYKAVTRDERGRFIDVRKWTPKMAVWRVEQRIKEEIRAEVSAEVLEKYWRYWQVHAKLPMTKGKKGGTLELEAYMYVRAVDADSAKFMLQEELTEIFGEGILESKIGFFANQVSKSEVEQTGIVKYRDMMYKEMNKWKQLTITSYL